VNAPVCPLGVTLSSVVQPTSMPTTHNWNGHSRAMIDSTFRRRTRQCLLTLFSPTLHFASIASKGSQSFTERTLARHDVAARGLEGAISALRA